MALPEKVQDAIRQAEAAGATAVVNVESEHAIVVTFTRRSGEWRTACWYVHPDTGGWRYSGTQGAPTIPKLTLAQLQHWLAA